MNDAPSTSKSSSTFPSKAFIRLSRDLALVITIFLILSYVINPGPILILLEERFGLTFSLLVLDVGLFVISVFFTVAIHASIRMFFDYLEVEESNTQKDPSVTLKNKLDEYLEKVKAELVTAVDAGRGGETVRFDISQDIKAELITSVVTTVKQQLDDGAFSILDKEFARRDQKYRQWEELITDFNAIKDRFALEVRGLQQRAKLNLAFGTFVTIIAGVGLLFIVFFRPLDLAGLAKEEYGWRIASHYIPRLSLIIFAEIFAYFFLKLYKADLSDIKYYQNEITNVEMRLAALRTALTVEQKELAREDKEIIKTVITSLVGTERNFILKKGETTVELEKAKYSGAGAREWAGHLASILKAKS
jgi:hypothetical protein